MGSDWEAHSFMRTLLGGTEGGNGDSFGSFEKGLPSPSSLPRIGSLAAWEEESPRGGRNGVEVRVRAREM